MTPENHKRSFRQDLLLAAIWVVAGVAVSGLSVAGIVVKHPRHVAQATPPLQGTPAPADQSKPAPAESKPGGERPTTPAPEPARPDAKAQQEGAKPALPPAPAEKTAPPIQSK